MIRRQLIIGLISLLVLQMLIPLFGTAAAPASATRADEGTTVYFAMQEDMPNFNYLDLASNSVWKDYVLGKWCWEGWGKKSQRFRRAPCLTFAKG